MAALWPAVVAFFSEKHGPPPGRGAAVLGMGSLGAERLNAASDLDLIVIYDGDGVDASDGRRPLATRAYYARLTQALVTALSAPTAEGRLYEVDMRLRPSGRQGPVATGLASFKSYQAEEAWTWEHQALVRARFVAGDAAVAARVDDVRREVLCQQRDDGALRAEVTAMRRRMREHKLPGGDADSVEFDLKQGSGGIVDIEFMVQYAVLAWAHRVPELVRWSDNVRILELLGREGLFAQRDCDLLTDAYLAFRSASHQLALQQLPGVVEAERFSAERAVVGDCWQSLFGDDAEGEGNEEMMGENNEPG